MRRILVVDDDAVDRKLLQALLSGESWSVASAGDGSSALALADSLLPELVILDLRLPGMSGLEVLTSLRARAPSLPVIILTAFGEVRTAVDAIRGGAFDYLTKPVEPEALLTACRRALETSTARDGFRCRADDESSLAQWMGNSPAISRVIEQVRSVSETGFTVLLTGETGSGKELVAQAIHDASPRRHRPFVAIDCGAIPEALVESELFGHEKGAFTGALQGRQGRFRLADGGTLFLDEVGNLPWLLQAKLLRVLESRQLHALGAKTARPLDVRVVAATNRDLQLLCREGRFRADLYFRLAQYSIQLPALRDRPEDISHLARRFIDEACAELRRPALRLTDEAMQALERHGWPGNVRELRNVVRQCVLDSDDVSLRGATVSELLRGSDSGRARVDPRLPQSLREAARAAAREAERSLILEALRRTGGNKSRAARLLQTDYKTLFVKTRELGLRGKDFTS